MEKEGIRPCLWLLQDPHVLDKWMKPTTPYILKAHELDTFMGYLRSLQMPTNYYSAPLKHIANKKLSSMKSHDWHIFMQQLFPLCIYGLLDQPTQIGFMCFNCVFKCICSKVLDPADMHTLQEDAVAITMCMLETTMPPAFFDVMMHLILHLVEKLDVAPDAYTMDVLH